MDNILSILLVEHQHYTMDGQQESMLRNHHYQRLLLELARIDKSPEQYDKHLDCECSRNSVGYRYDQSIQMRDAFRFYSGDSL